MYQQTRSHKDIYGTDMQMHSAFWEHEALANFWGQEHFKDPRCVTDCILKTKQDSGHGDSATITVYAHGYRKVSDGDEEQHVSNNTCPDAVGLYLEQSVGFHFGDQPFVVAGTGTTSAKMEFNRSLHHLYHTCVKKSTLVNFI